MNEALIVEELQQYFTIKNYTQFLRKVDVALKYLSMAQQWDVLNDLVLNKVNVYLILNNKLAASQVLAEYSLLLVNYGTVAQKVVYYNLLAATHEGLVEKEKVFAYLKKAKKLAEKHQATDLLPHVYHNVSIYYYDNQRLEKSIIYAQKSVALFEGQSGEYVQRSIMHYARLLQQQQKLVEAESLLQSVTKHFAQQPITNETILFWKVRAQQFARQGFTKEGYTFLKNKLSIVAEHSKWCEELYAEICRLSKLCNEASIYIQDLKDYLAIKNRVLTVQNSEQLQLLDAYFDDTNLKRLAWTDTLTQIPNRRYLEDMYPQIEAPFAAFILDIDSFKKINDTEGHLIGDEVLKLVVQALTQALAEQHVHFVRLGGDEFFGIIKLPTTADLSGIATQMVHAVRAIRLQNGDHVVSPTISLGMCYIFEQMALEGVLKLADEALYDAKERGKNQYVLVNEVI